MLHLGDYIYEYGPEGATGLDDPSVIYRAFRFGGLVELWMLDERKYRDQQPASALFGYGSFDPAANDPGRSMLGVRQRAHPAGAGPAAVGAATQFLRRRLERLPGRTQGPHQGLRRGAGRRRDHDGHANGFGVVDFTADRVQRDFWHLDDVTDPASPARVAASWRTDRGSRPVQPTGTPLPPR